MGQISFLPQITPAQYRKSLQRNTANHSSAIPSCRVIDWCKTIKSPFEFGANSI